MHMIAYYNILYYHVIQHTIISLKPKHHLMGSWGLSWGRLAGKQTNHRKRRVPNQPPV